jgi:hypothetical protein
MWRDMYVSDERTDVDRYVGYDRAVGDGRASRLDVPETTLLGLEVPKVPGVRRRRERLHGDDIDAASAQSLDLDGVVGEQAYGPDPEGVHDGRRFVVAAGVHRQTQCQVGVDGVTTVVLHGVAAQLVEETDAARLMAGDVDEDATIRGRYRPQRESELDSAIASERLERVTGEALGVDACQNVGAPLHLTVNEGEVHVA